LEDFITVTNSVWCDCCCWHFVSSARSRGTTEHHWDRLQSPFVVMAATGCSKRPHHRIRCTLRTRFTFDAIVFVPT